MKKLFLLSLVCLLPGIMSAQETGGIGAMMAIDSSDGYRLPVIKNVLPNSPAAASLHENLFVLKVNEVSCRNMTLQETVAMIRGAAGTHVKLLAADNKEGKHAKDYDLVRAVIQMPATNVAPADPQEAFQKACDIKVKQLRKNGYQVIKTFNSDCGNYFFNFNADTGTYQIAAYSLNDKGNNITVSIYDSRSEDHITKLVALPESNPVAQQGKLSFSKAGVGGIKTELSGDQKCKAVYIIVYR